MAAFSFAAPWNNFSVKLSTDRVVIIESVLFKIYAAFNPKELLPLDISIESSSSSTLYGIPLKFSIETIFDYYEVSYDLGINSPRNSIELSNTLEHIGELLSSQAKPLFTGDIAPLRSLAKYVYNKSLNSESQMQLIDCAKRADKAWVNRQYQVFLDLTKACIRQLPVCYRMRFEQAQSKQFQFLGA